MQILSTFLNGRGYGLSDEESSHLFSVLSHTDSQFFRGSARPVLFRLIQAVPTSLSLRPRLGCYENHSFASDFER